MASGKQIRQRSSATWVKHQHVHSTNYVLSTIAIFLSLPSISALNLSSSSFLLSSSSFFFRSSSNRFFSSSSSLKATAPERNFDQSTSGLGGEGGASDF